MATKKYVYWINESQHSAYPYVIVKDTLYHGATEVSQVIAYCLTEEEAADVLQAVKRVQVT